MTTITSASDHAVLAELGARLARLRLDRNLSQDDLAREAGVSKRTLHRMEHGQSAQLTNWLRVLRALGRLEHLEQLLPAAAPSPIQQLKLQGRQRRRASSAPKPADKGKPWTWGDER